MDTSRRTFLSTACVGLAAASLGRGAAAEASAQDRTWLGPCSALKKVDNVNTADLIAALTLGRHTMQHVFNADDPKKAPFFGSLVCPKAELTYSSENHVTGRHLNALLNMEALGVPVDEAAIEQHASAAYFSYSGPLPLPLNRGPVDAPLDFFSPHHVREGFHALYALAKYRDSAQAREIAERSIAAIVELWDPERGWDEAVITGKHGLRFHQLESYIMGLARSIGPLVKYYRATDYGPALDLALALAAKATDGYFRPDGGYDVPTFGPHTHSTTSVMSSLAQLADLTRDMNLLTRVKAFYDNGLWEIRDELGWVLENTGVPISPDQGEANNTGDIVETALILGKWGYTDYYADAERIVRGHLLPSQLRDVSFITDPPNPDGKDGLRDVANRHLGAFGFPAPYGHSPLDKPATSPYPEVTGISYNMDIVGGAVGSLCEVLRETAQLDESGHRVAMLFDRETDAISVESPYTHPALSVTVKEPKPLWVRMPDWVDREALVVKGSPAPPRFEGAYLFFAEPPVGEKLEIQFPLPDAEITLKHKTRDIRVRMRGDAVQAMDNFGALLTFFDPIE